MATLRPETLPRTRGQRENKAQLKLDAQATDRFVSLIVTHYERLSRILPRATFRRLCGITQRIFLDVRLNTFDLLKPDTNKAFEKIEAHIVELATGSSG